MIQMVLRMLRPVSVHSGHGQENGVEPDRDPPDLCPTPPEPALGIRTRFAQHCECHVGTVPTILAYPTHPCTPLPRRPRRGSAPDSPTIPNGQTGLRTTPPRTAAEHLPLPCSQIPTMSGAGPADVIGGDQEPHLVWKSA